MPTCEEKLRLGANRRQAGRRDMPMGWLHTSQNILDINVIGHAIGVRIFGRRYAFANNLRPVGPERQEVAADFAELDPSGVPSDPSVVLARGS
ncbi:hypothetical protein ABIF21_002364 [Bradyrhizobium elkanii]|jgi:hypothetical protein|uniref:hypothetical protein n=1 Tax=Bradyrhizobium elkanii TaxID=29448 RepID=UPI001021208B|nr:hypothetical protein [Bradyrhizobium elkanii]MCW2117260.1 hypothetical protein [Bradyrhizobium elkanii]NWL39855.1 hypothetical protein [Bradyrhizobium elkanii]RYM25792.1 hypothetical protein EWH13_16785 [Bradyrhizobium elkanii]